MYTLTFKGRSIGKKYLREQEAVSAFIRLHPVFLGLGWSKCR